MFIDVFIYRPLISHLLNPWGQVLGQLNLYLQMLLQAQGMFEEKQLIRID